MQSVIKSSYHYKMTACISLSAEVPEDLTGNRLDQIAAVLFPDYSRARLQAWIKEGSLTVNSQARRARDRLKFGDLLEIEAKLALSEEYTAEPIPLNIIYEDEALVILNKASSMVVHPAAGHRMGTLLNGLLYAFPELKTIPRAGIVHRLDKDTTGLMVVAKTLQSHAALVKQLQTREVEREYEAVVKGVLTGGGSIDAPLGRHPVNRKKKAVLEGGKESITHYRVLERFRSHTHVQMNLETGRTHQIRVHMAHINHGLVGDPLYGGRLQIPVASSLEFTEHLRKFKRQALHAKRLSFQHPTTNEKVEWTTETPTDLKNLLIALNSDRALSS